MVLLQSQKREGGRQKNSSCSLRVRRKIDEGNTGHATFRDDGLSTRHTFLSPPLLYRVKQDSRKMQLSIPPPPLFRARLGAGNTKVFNDDGHQEKKNRAYMGSF